MAIDANIFKTSATSAAYVNPIIWSEAIEQAARESEIMRALGVTDTRALGTGMTQINIAKNQVFTAADLTEGTATPVTALAYDQVTVTFTERGLAKQVSEKELSESISAVFSDITANMGTALGERRDVVIITAAAAGADSIIYADGVLSTTIVASNVFNTDLIADGKTAMRVNKRMASNLVIHPNQNNALIKDTQFTDASIYGGRETVLNGEIGKYLGIRVLEHTSIVSATENSVTVYQALLMGPRPYVFAPSLSPKIRWKEDSVLDRAVTFEAHESYGVSVLNAESIIVLKSV